MASTLAPGRKSSARTPVTDSQSPRGGVAASPDSGVSTLDSRLSTPSSALTTHDSRLTTHDPCPRALQDLEQYRSRLLEHACRLTGNYPDADELTQDTLLRAWERRDQYQEGSEPMAWLYTILINLYKDRRTEESRRDRYSLPLLEPGQADDYWQNELKDPRLRRLLGKLPRECAEILIRVAQGWDIADLARLRGVTEATLKTRLHRARELAQELLEEIAWEESHGARG